MVGSFVPALITVWPLKILTDHVILQQPLTASEVRFPVYIQPFIDMLAGLEPTGVLLTTLLSLLLLVVVFGAGIGEGEGNISFLAQGQDTASQSENMLSAGWSMAGGVWGLADLLCNIRLVQRINNALRTHLFSRLIHLPFRTLDNHRIGDSVYRTMYDVPAIQGVCFDLTLMPVIALLGAMTSLAVMDYSYGETIPELFWLGIATMPLALLLTAPLASWSRKISQESRGAGTATTNQIEQQFTSVGAIQSHGVEGQVKDKFANASKESFRRFRRIVLVNIGIDVLSVGGALAGMWIWMFLLVSEKVIEGVLLPGDYITMTGLFGVIAGASLTFGRLWIDLQQNVAGVRRSFFYLDLEQEDSQRGQLEFPKFESLRFENVSYSYDSGHPILDHVSFELAGHKTVVIVGSTGAGKTTLASLIPGFLTPTEGDIFINDLPLSNIRTESLRRNVSFVYQEHNLFSESVRENLLRSAPDATDAQLVTALQQSEAIDFVEQLPYGLDTILGSNGASLSVGQKHRLSIARGLLRRCPILILDEPSAALDAGTESRLIHHLVQDDSIQLLMVIAHRPLTIMSAELILFLNEGKLAGVGTHDQLMSSSELYRGYVNPQQSSPQSQN